MLRPESTSLAAAVLLFVVFTILSPDLFPNKLTYISIMSVGGGSPEFVSIGVTLLMIAGGHFDSFKYGAVLGLASYVCVRRPDARLRIAVDCRGAGRRWRWAPRWEQSTGFWWCDFASTPSWLRWAPC